MICDAKALTSQDERLIVHANINPSTSVWTTIKGLQAYFSINMPEY